jgi:glycosyltransferase involved in cell wall biosynthesis/GT2 family glycosyltransferase
MDATIIIPTFNRWDALLETLEALARVDHPANRWEAIVIDDGSNDETEESIRKWIGGASINIRYLRQANAGPAAARNRGAAEARGKNLIFVDNDIVVQPSFVRAHVEALRANPGCWILGRVTHPSSLRDTPFGRYRDSLFEAFYEAHGADRLSDTDGMSTQNVSMPTEDFRRFGGFDESFTIASSEDWELATRARRAGLRVLYDPRITVIHNDWAVTLDSFCERQRLYSVSDVILWRKYGEACLRTGLVRESSPIDWRKDKARLIVKKAIKNVLATNPGWAALRQVSRLAERIAPDSHLSHRAYDVAVGVAIFRGVREGLRHYDGTPPAICARATDRTPAEIATNKESFCRVYHLIDKNFDTNYFRSIARHHDRERFPVSIGSISSDGALQAAMEHLGVGTFTLRAATRWQYPLAVLRLVRLLRRADVAVLHAHCFDPTFIGLLAARIAGVPFVFTRHHSDHNIRIGKRWHTRIDAWCAKHADRVVAVSKATREVLTDVEHVPTEQITVVYNGMDPLHVPAAEDVDNLRLELGLLDEFVVLMLARLHEEKGHRYLFDAIPSILSHYRRVVFLLAGEGPHREHLEADIRERGLQDAVRFLGQRDDVARLISLASVVVVPSLAESFGFVVLEAMSLGKPVVAAATGGIPELVTDGENGLLVPPADSRALSDAILRVIQNPEWAGRLAECGRTRVRAFSFERMIRAYEGVYSTILRASTLERVDPRESAESAEGGTIAG